MEKPNLSILNFTPKVMKQNVIFVICVPDEEFDKEPAIVIYKLMDKNLD